MTMFDLGSNNAVELSGKRAHLAAPWWIIMLIKLRGLIWRKRN
jgi:hypothetical protein